MTYRRRISSKLALIVGLGLLAGFVPVGPVAADHNPQYILTLPYDSNRFTSYDYRQGTWGDVDWPTGYLFTGNANINKVKDGLCTGTSYPWKYCATGGPQYMYVEGVASGQGGSWAGFDSDSGRKRFSQDCGSTEWTAHPRLYAPQVKHGQSDDTFFSLYYGYMVVATSHLDYQDAPGCGYRTHGYTEIAENWLSFTVNAVPGWTTYQNNSVYFSNANSSHTRWRELSGWYVAHIYDNDGNATYVDVQ